MCVPYTHRGKRSPFFATALSVEEDEEEEERCVSPKVDMSQGKEEGGGGKRLFGSARLSLSQRGVASRGSLFVKGPQRATLFLDKSKQSQQKKKCPFPTGSQFFLKKEAITQMHSQPRNKFSIHMF